ncbi:MAG: NADH-quinone oxidoreductase subunit A [Promethearchaeota archaeon]
MLASLNDTIASVFNFILAFAIILLVVLLLYWIGKRLAPSNPTKEKTTTYACGEDVPAIKAQFHSHLLRYAVYFTIADIVAFIIATSMGVLGWIVVMYVLIVFISVIALRR